MASATVSHKLLGQMLVERGLLPEEDLQKALALQTGAEGAFGQDPFGPGLCFAAGLAECFVRAARYPAR